jgi:hypothetical protein
VHVIRIRSLGTLVPGLALGLALALPARADESCAGFLPDLRCERPARYDGFVAPLSTPYLFEEPFVNSSLSAWYLYHEFPDKSVTAGGSATVYALQARLALTDRIAFIATQDGYMQFRPELSLLDDDADGWMNWMAGVKVALIDLPERRFILSPSVRFQAAQGSSEVLAGNGHGIWVPGMSFGWGPGPLRILGSVAAELPLNGDENSSPLFWNLHVALPLDAGFTPLVELNGIHYMDDGDGDMPVELVNGANIPIETAFAAVGVDPEEGNDVLNFGSQGVKGNDILSFTVGARMRLMDHMSLGVGWEHPITRRKDLLQNRLYVNLAWEL